MDARKYVDCREAPNDVGCTLRISGQEDEVVRAAAEHACSVHGETDGAELREMIRGMLKDEPAGDYGASGAQPSLH